MGKTKDLKKKFLIVLHLLDRLHKWLFKKVSILYVLLFFFTAANVGVQFFLAGGNFVCMHLNVCVSV